MNITNVAWSRDHTGKPVLELRLDGHPAYIRSSQKAELTRRGIVEGVVVLASERSAHLPNVYLRRGVPPGFQELELAGCTDDAEVFALYQAMCEAIRTNHWHECPRVEDDQSGTRHRHR